MLQTDVELLLLWVKKLLKTYKLWREGKQEISNRLSSDLFVCGFMITSNAIQTSSFDSQESPILFFASASLILIKDVLQSLTKYRQVLPFLLEILRNNMLSLPSIGASDKLLKESSVIFGQKVLFC